MSQPVAEGLNVVEIGAGSIAASLAGMILADNGARVVKVEPPNGDGLRTGSPSGFVVWNRGKESFVQDLRTAAGRATARSLVDDADVLLLGLSPARISEWGFDDEPLRAANPALVYCSITGFGPAGRYTALKAYEGVVQAKVGAYSRGIFAWRDGPIFSSAPTASTGAAHLAVSGILAALIARETTGRGQRVDTSLVQGLIPFDYFGIYHVQLAARAEAAGGTGPNTAPGEGMAASRYALTLPTKDGRWINLSPQQPHQAHALLRAVGLEATLEEPRFANAPFFASAEDAQAWEDMLWERFRAKTWLEIEPDLFGQDDLPYELCGTSEEALDHSQIIANGEVVEVDDAAHGLVRAVGPVARFTVTPSAITRSAPELGVHETGGFTPSNRPVASGATPPHALSGVTIVEFGFFYAMPFSNALSASLGARMIKLEDRNGDPIRYAFGGEAGSAKVMEGKESLSIDLRSDEGRAAVHRLIARADMFVLGFRPGVAERLGVDYATLSAINPKLVYVHAAGYGVDGPYSHRPVYASTALALAGNVNRHAGFWMDPELAASFDILELQHVIAPRLRGPIDGDSNAAQTALTAAMLGLYHQRRTGEGQFLSTSMIGGNLYSYSDDAVTYTGKQPLPIADSEQMGLGALYRLYKAANGWIFLAAMSDDERVAVERELGVDLNGNDEDRIRILTKAFAERAAEDCERTLTEAGVGCAVSHDDGHPAFIAFDDDIHATGLSADIEHPMYGTIRRHGLPVTLSETPGRLAPGCLRGQHTEPILSELGYSPDEITDLLRRSVAFGGD